MDDEKKTADKNAGSGWTRILDSIKGGKGRKIIMAAGLVGMALILASEFWPGQKAAGTAAKTTAEDFLEKTEAKLADVVGSIQGAGKCRIMVTLENGVEYVYATQQKVNTDRQEGTDGNSSKLNQRDDTEESIVIVETENGRAGAAGDRAAAHGQGGRHRLRGRGSAPGAAAGDGRRHHCAEHLFQARVRNETH